MSVRCRLGFHRRERLSKHIPFVADWYSACVRCGKVYRSLWTETVRVRRAEYVESIAPFVTGAGEQ